MRLGIMLFVMLFPTFLWTVLPCVAYPASAAPTCGFRQIGRALLRTATGYVLEVKLLADYDNVQSFCGHMEAIASISNPAHGSNGNLSVHLSDCHEEIAQASNYLPTGGLYGETRQAQTSALLTPCGMASANFVGSYYDPMSLSVKTDLVDGKYVPYHRQR